MELSIVSIQIIRCVIILLHPSVWLERSLGPRRRRSRVSEALAAG